MTPRAYRVRRVLLWITLGMLGVVVAAWGVSFWRQAHVVHARQRDFASAVSGNGNAGWTHQEVFFGLQVRSGVIHAGFVRRCASSSHGVPPPHFYGPFGEGWNAEILDYGLPETCEDRVVGSLVPELQWDGIGSWRIPGARFQCEWNSQNLSVGGSFSGLLLSLILVTASWLMWFPTRASSVRRARNQCIGCGYERRGLAAEAVCPECGWMAKGGA